MGALKKVQRKTIREKLLKEFSCLICKQVMAHPVPTSCAHNFCKLCLEEAFSGQSFVRERRNSVRMLRARKNIMKCPSCPNDISNFLKDPQMIESLRKRHEENGHLAEEKGEEATDVSEVIPDPCPGSSNTSGENHEETGVDGGAFQNHTTTCKSKRANKRKKVDVEDCLVKKSDQEENWIATEKVESEAGQIGGGNVKVVTKEMESEEALKEGNDSPASPLLISSNGQDRS